MSGAAFDPIEFAATLERMAQGRDAIFDQAQPSFDPRLAQEVRAQARDGRRIEDFKRVLEHHGFSYVPAERMRWTNGMRKNEGEWRCPRYRLAFTDQEVLSGFRSPEDFDTWITDLLMKRRAKAAGISLLR